MIAAADRPDAFGWVDDYFDHIRPHFDVRQADSLLIVLPNRAVKLNETGLAILKHLKDGGRIDDILTRAATAPERRRELFYFLCDFRSLMTGCLGEGRRRKAVRVEPYGGSFNTLPVLSEVAVTYRCNIRCKFCYAGCGCSRSDDGDEMAADEVIRVLRIIRRDAQVPSVSFTGGEPTMREDLEQLVAAATGEGLRVNLITNGTLLAGNDRARRLADAGLISAQVSLEGPNAEVHDGLVGVDGSFERTLAGLEAFRAAGVHVHTHTTINALNAEHLGGLVELVARLELARMSMNMVIPAGSAADLSIQVSYERIGEIVLSARDAARAAGVGFMWYSPTPMCIFNPLAEGLGNKSCAACDGLLSVAPNGDVLPCSSYDEPVGNLLTQPFAEVWSGGRAVFFREKQYAPDACDGCEDFAACAGACPLYFSAMGEAELAAAGRRAHVLP